VSGAATASWDQDTLSGDLTTAVPYDHAGEQITLTFAMPKFITLAQQGGDTVQVTFTTSNSDAGQYIATFNAAARVSSDDE
jgi:hypothetical protein